MATLEMTKSEAKAVLKLLNGAVEFARSLFPEDEAEARSVKALDDLAKKLAAKL